MNNRKLFQVLVIGGALLGVGCETERPTSSGLAEDDAGGTTADASRDGLDGSGATGLDGATVVDATPGEDAAAAAADAQAPIEDAGDLINCGFCPNEECCVDDGAGGTVTRDGFECCWSTSC